LQVGNSPCGHPPQTLLTTEDGNFYRLLPGSTENNGLAAIMIYLYRSMASKEDTEYYSAILPAIDLDKNVVAKEIVSISSSANRYYTVSAVGTTTSNSVQVSGTLREDIEKDTIWNVIISVYTDFCAFAINFCFSKLDLQKRGEILVRKKN
jgi:hypothetical protein